MQKYYGMSTHVPTKSTLRDDSSAVEEDFVIHRKSLGYCGVAFKSISETFRYYIISSQK